MLEYAGALFIGAVACTVLIGMLVVWWDARKIRHEWQEWADTHQYEAPKDEAGDVAH